MFGADESVTNCLSVREKYRKLVRDTRHFATLFNKNGCKVKENEKKGELEICAKSEEEDMEVEMQM